MDMQVEIKTDVDVNTDPDAGQHRAILTHRGQSETVFQFDKPKAINQNQKPKA
jgi:hypothetical protein